MSEGSGSGRERAVESTGTAWTGHSLARLSTTEIAALEKERSVVVQPIGSIEQHGPHLPVVTDSYIAESLVKGSVSLLERDGPDVWILPTLSYGRSAEHAGFVGTVSLSADTLLSVCRDVGRSVAVSGFHRLVFVNGHGGNVALLDVAARDIRAETVACPDRDFAAHADFLETSVMLALDETMVHLDRAKAGGESAVRLFGKQDADMMTTSVSTAWLTRDLSSNGVIGDPSRATAEIGRRIVDSWQHSLVACYREIAAFEFGATP